MSQHSATSYDTVLYRGIALPHTHPDRLATHAWLQGLEPAPVEHCRVLELGCGNGSNLLPMAFGLPESEFVGIDLAARPIASAQETARAAGLSNITLHQLDVMDLPADWGTFDYIIAHGFYSWVPPDVQDRLLDVCRTHLAPRGVAFISYNVYPGWHLFEASREMMLFHTRPFKDPEKQTRQGRSLLHFLRDAQPEGTEQGASYREFLQKEVERISGYPDWFLHHDMMAETNTPCYFHEFAEHAERHALQYLAEAEFGVMHARDFPSQVAQMLNQFGSLIHREQYLDFLRGRSFRQTLLCHQEAPLKQAADFERMRALYVAAPMHEVETSEEDEESVVAFTGVKGHKIETKHPFTREVCRYLGACWPRYVSFDELLETARERSGAAVPEEQAVRVLGEILYEFYVDNFIELHAHAPRLAHEVSKRPVASPLARIQLQTSPIVSTLLHTSVQLNEVEQRLLPLLDGTRGHAAVLAAWTGEARKKDADALSMKALRKVLAGLMRHGLLLA